MSPRRLLLFVGVVALLAIPTATSAHLLDHPVPSATGSAPPLSSEFNSGGEDADWELLATIPTANPHSDIDYFTQGGETYMAVGVLGVAANGGGQSIIRLTSEGQVMPEPVSNHPSASCVSNPSAALGLQHDVEATPKGKAILNTDVPGAAEQDAQLLLDATDAEGRCHDQGLGGIADAPSGGLEIVDITDIENPKEIGLTSHIGEAHTVNVDPRRPHIAYTVTSDSISVNADGERENDSGAGRELDGFEIVDLRSCMEAPLGTIPPGTAIEQKRELCRPEVFRYRYPTTDIVMGHTNRGSVYGCHELEVYPDDRLTCGSGSAMILFDMSKAFDDNGTPADFTDDTPKGAPLPCALRDSSTADPAFTTGAKVTDCVVGKDGVDLGVPGWKEIGAPSLEGVEHIGSAFHMGRSTSTGALQPAYGSKEDIDFDHEAELTHSRRFVIATDERGGGVTGGAQCSPGADLEFANGGLHAYAVDRLQKSTPAGDDPEARAAKAFEAYARDSKGEKAVFRAPIQTEPKGSFCTAHVFQQVPGENRIFMGWYSQGTQVVDFTENADGTVDFERAGYFVPENANQWVSHVFERTVNPDGTHTYFGATGDGIVGDAGRNGIDVYKVTLPAPPVPAGSTAQQPDPDSGCAYTAGFARTSVQPSGDGEVRLDFTRASSNPVTIAVRRVGARKSVARFADREESVVWRPGKLRNGTYVVRFKTRTVGGKRDVRREVLRVRNNRFTELPPYTRPKSCGLLRKAALSRPVFGGRKDRKLRMRIVTGALAKVRVVVLRGERPVKRFRVRKAAEGKALRFKLSPKGLRRGLHEVRITAKRGKRTASVTLASRKQR